MKEVIEQIFNTEEICEQHINKTLIECKKKLEEEKKKLQGKESEAKKDILLINKKYFESTVDKTIENVEDELNKIKKSKELLLEYTDLIGELKKSIISTILQ